MREHNAVNSNAGSEDTAKEEAWKGDAEEDTVISDTWWEDTALEK